MKNKKSDFTWHELNTSDPERARAFYGELFGWTYKTFDLGEMGPYTTIHDAQGTDLGGIASLDPREKKAPRWLTFVHIQDVDGAAKRVPLLGGSVRVPPMDIPDVGRFAVIEDPSGAELALLQRHA